MKGGACAAIVKSNRIELSVTRRRKRVWEDEEEGEKDEAKWRGRRREWSGRREKLCEAWDRKISKTQLAGSEDPFGGDAVRRLASRVPPSFSLFLPFFSRPPLSRPDNIADESRSRKFIPATSFYRYRPLLPPLTRQFQRVLNDSSRTRNCATPAIVFCACPAVRLLSGRHGTLSTLPRIKSKPSVVFRRSDLSRGVLTFLLETRVSQSAKINEASTLIWHSRLKLTRAKNYDPIVAESWIIAHES